MFLSLVTDYLTFNRSNKKRPYSSSRRSSGGLEPVEEENINHYSDPNFKLGPLPENGWTLEHGENESIPS